jgi:hypothetical protein
MQSPVNKQNKRTPHKRLNFPANTECKQMKIRTEKYGHVTTPDYFTAGHENKEHA